MINFRKTHRIYHEINSTAGGKVKILPLDKGRFLSTLQKKCDLTHSVDHIVFVIGCETACKKPCLLSCAKPELSYCSVRF